MRRALSTAILVASLGILAACGSDTPTETATDTQTSTEGASFNDADVSFATGMIQHHAQALEMTDLTVGRELDPEMETLVANILAAQGPEIEEMVDWLTAWDQPIPATSRDHANAHGGGMDDMDMGEGMPGMMTADQMTALKDATDQEFQGMWLSMMIEHHTGAIEMAQTQVDNGKSQDALDLAVSIVESQTAEITTMEQLAQRLG